MSVAILEKNGTVSAEKTRQQEMVSAVLPPVQGRKHTRSIIVGSRVLVTSYGPFRRMRGSVLNIHLLEDRPIENVPEKLYGVYQVQLDEVSEGPVEFHSDDIELLTAVATW